MGTDGRVRVEVLGPLRVITTDGTDRTPDGGLQRRLLALLVLHRGRIVSTDAAVEALWPAKLPRDPVGALQNHLSRLRRVLPPGAVTSVADGYRLAPEAIDLDVDRLTTALHDGTTLDRDAQDDIDALLDRWHGPAYPELADVDDGRAEAVRLDDVRIRAREVRAEVRLARGEIDGLAADLAALAAEAPLRERPRELLMATLAATGRQVEALRVFDDFRRALGDELGIEPSPVLVARHAALLAGETGRSDGIGTGGGGRRSADADAVGDGVADAVGDGVADAVGGGSGRRHGDGERHGRGESPGDGDGTSGREGDRTRSAGGTGVGAGSGAVGWAPPGRLPITPTSLVGRDAFVAELAALVDRHRMVTLVGPGGVGKTRLLLEVGRGLQETRPDRPVVLCELAAVDPSTAVTAVSTALGIDARPGVPPVDRVAGVLGDAAVTLLIDNCEHVLGPVAGLAAHLLAHCPNVSVVATSRERLRVAGERVGAVPPLAAGRHDSAAVQLFVERAQAVAPEFAPAGDEMACVEEIVRRLDGLPLAIELAAARLYTHDVREVAAGLDHRFTLLSAGDRTEARHGSLAAAVSWSMGLLDDRLRGTFAALSAFAGPFRAADAAAVCGVDEPAATEALVELTERSLVMRAPGRGFVLLETLRAFGADELDRSGTTALVRTRHAHHVVPLVEGADERLTEPGGAALAEIDALLPEVRAALAWLLDQGDVALAGRLVSALLDFGIMRLRPDVLLWSEQVIAADPADEGPHAALMWVVAAYAAWMAGDLVATAEHGARALAVAEPRDGPTSAEVPTIQGSIALFEGRLDDAVAWYARAEAMADDDPNQRLMASSTATMTLGYAGDPSAPARAAALLAEVGDEASPYTAYAWYCAAEAVLADDPALAQTRYARALAMAEQTETSFVIGLAGASKASIDARSGDPEEAARQYRWLLDHWRRSGMWSTQWTMLRSVAGLLHRLGRHRDAAVLAGAVRSTAAGHRIFGDDLVALDDLASRLRAELGAAGYTEARDAGAVLDGDAAVEHALRAL